MSLPLPLIILVGVSGLALFVGALAIPEHGISDGIAALRRAGRSWTRQPKHAPLPRRVPLRARTAVPFADPQDATDPYGSVWAGSLKDPVQGTPLEPLPPRVHRERPALPVLERVRAGLLALPPLPVAGVLEMLPPDEPPAETPAPEPARQPDPLTDSQFTAGLREELKRWLETDVRSVKVPYDLDGLPVPEVTA